MATPDPNQPELPQHIFADELEPALESPVHAYEVMFRGFGGFAARFSNQVDVPIDTSLDKKKDAIIASHSTIMAVGETTLFLSRFGTVRPKKLGEWLTSDNRGVWYADLILSPIEAISTGLTRFKSRDRIERVCELAQMDHKITPDALSGYYYTALVAGER